MLASPGYLSVVVKPWLFRSLWGTFVASSFRGAAVLVRA